MARENSVNNLLDRYDAVGDVLPASRYFTTAVACPKCGEPYGQEIQPEIESTKENGTYFLCNSCNTAFRMEISLGPYTHDNSISKLESMNTFVRNSKKFILPRCVQLNSVEEDLCQFISSGERGKFIVTWPERWGSPRFISVAIADFLRFHPSSRVAIVYNEAPKSNVALDIMKAYKSLLVTNEVGEKITTPTIMDVDKTDLEKKVLVLRKISEVRVNVDKRLTDIPFPPKFHFMVYHTHKKASDEAIKQMEAKYGCGSVRSVKRSLKKDPVILNDKGFLDLELKEISHRGSMRYSIEALNHYLSSEPTLVESVFPSTYIGNGVTNTECKNVIFIPHSLPDPLNTSLAIGADLIIIENSDEWVRNISDQGIRRGTIADLLDAANETTVFLFSSRGSYRDDYGFGMQSGLASMDGVTSITLDNARILKGYSQRSTHISGENGPCSTEWRYPKMLPTLNIDYIKCDEIDELIEFEAVLNNSIISKAVEPFERVIKYLTSLSRSLTPPISYSNPPNLPPFAANGINIVQIKELINDSPNEMGNDRATEWEEIKSEWDRRYLELLSVLENIYGKFWDDHPLVKKALEIANKHPEQQTIFVMNQRDVDNANLIFQNIFYTVGKKPVAVGWKNLTSVVNKIGPEQITIVLLVPMIGSPNKSLVGGARIVALGSSYSLELIRMTVQERLSEVATNPVIAPPECGALPKIYSEVISDVIPDPGRNRMLYCDPSRGEYRVYDENSKDSFLEVSQKAFMLESEHYIVFIPQYTTVLTVTENGFLDTLEVGKMNPEDSYGITILLGKTELYRNFKFAISDIILNHPCKIPIMVDKFVWNSFSELFEDSQKWINRLEEAIAIMQERSGPDTKMIEEELASRLGKSDTRANDPRTIMGWWRNYEESENGSYRVFNTERPSRLEDVKEIYKTLNELVPEMGLKEIEAIRSYYAAQKWQQMREDLMKEKNNQITSTLLPKVKIIIEKLKEESNPLVITTVSKIEITRRVRSFSQIRKENWRNFAKSLERAI